MPPADWTTTGQFTAIQYGAAGGFPTPAISAAIGGGMNFFAGGNAPLSTATQTVSVENWATEIDGGTVAATLSGDLGGWESQGDNMTVVATYLNASDGVLGQFKIGPVTPAGRDYHTTLLPRSSTGIVPTGTRSIQIVMTSTRIEGEYDDGYGDNISLTLASIAALGPSGIVQAPPSSACVSRRSFTIHIREYKGIRYRQVTVVLNGKRLSVTRGHRITAPIDLRGLPRGRYVMRITVTTTTGATISGTRTYHTCRAHPLHPRRRPTL